MTALPLRRSDRSNSGLGEVRWGPLRFTARAGPGLELTVRWIGLGPSFGPDGLSDFGPGSPQNEVFFFKKKTTASRRRVSSIRESDFFPFFSKTRNALTHVDCIMIKDLVNRG